MVTLDDIHTGSIVASASVLIHLAHQSGLHAEDLYHINNFHVE